MSEQPQDAAVRRATRIAETLVNLADTLVDDFDVVELLDRLALASVTLLDVAAAGILLDDQHGNLSVMSSSSEETRLLEMYQLQSEQGPCLDCVRSASPVSCGDLAAQSERWPLFVPAALERGFRSVVAVPLRLRSSTIGALNLFRTEPVETSAEDQRLAQALADVATIGVLQQRTAHRTSVLAEQLQHALSSRIVIEQAKGVLAERRTLSMEAAFDALRRFARDGNLKLSDAALRVVRGEADPGGPRAR